LGACPPATPKDQTTRPTNRQLAYLRDLALKTGQTFTTPITRDRASREIARLRKLTTEETKERRHEGDELGGEPRTGDGAHARVCSDEIEGYGSTAGLR
jgi:hypothetical protein